MNRPWTPTRRSFLAATFALSWMRLAESANAPALMLAKNFDAERAGDLTNFFMSEKLDGVRAYWTGAQLVTRAGHQINAPRWYVERFPREPLDGELWSDRGAFELTSGIVRSTAASDDAWAGIRYMIFDLPSQAAQFATRAAMMREIVSRADVSWLRVIEQKKVDSSASITTELQRIEAKGGEGLMLHRGAARYRAGRSDDLLKLKSVLDAEARVIGYEPGKGKYIGVVGALVVEREDGVQFKIGSGLDDAERRDPPRVGAWVTYAYNGETSSGLPRFPRFVRVRED